MSAETRLAICWSMPQRLICRSIPPAPDPDSTNRNGFAGHDRDKNWGLVDMKARFYSPHLGRFLTGDTFIGKLSDRRGSTNAYAYVQEFSAHRHRPNWSPPASSPTIVTRIRLIPGDGDGGGGGGGGDGGGGGGGISPQDPILSQANYARSAGDACRAFIAPVRSTTSSQGSAIRHLSRPTPTRPSVRCRCRLERRSLVTTEAARALRPMTGHGRKILKFGNRQRDW